ncbi:MAG: hypothetical protein NT062_33420 [Proteobacteria bacterium]|nr:hypothetical protein [Pseudomonadota bacterium]
MRRTLCLLFAACEPPVPPAPPPAPPVAYAPPPIPWAHGAAHGRLGRSQAPTPTTTLGIQGTGGPLRLPTIWSVPGAGPARAVVYGEDGATAAIDLVDIDAGRVVWRDTKCGGPIVGVTALTIVCADVHGTRAIAIADASLDWETTDSFLAFDDDRVVIAGTGAVSIRKADGGDELAHVALPPDVLASDVIASCPDSEVFAVARDHLVRIVAAPGAVGKVTWTRPTVPRKLDGCRGKAVLAVEGSQLVAIDRATGKSLGAIDDYVGHWPARDGSDRVEVATRRGTVIAGRELGEPRATSLPVLGELLATRGDRRLVRATPMTAALLDREGVRGYVAFTELGGALGERALVAGRWDGSPSETVHRRALPTEARRTLRLPPMAPATAVAAELRDLPAIGEPPPQADFATSTRDPLVAIELDPFDPTSLHAITGTPEHVAVTRANLVTRTWGPTTSCGVGQPIGFAIARDVVVCAARRAASPAERAEQATVVAIANGAIAWTWRGANVDAVEAAGDVVLVFDGDRARVLAARDGRMLGTLASDDGAAVRAVAVQRGTETLVVAVERGELVARSPIAGLLPVWSIGVDGVVAKLAVSGDGVLVALEDGDAYRVELRGVTITALPGLGLDWQASAELVVGSGLGGPVYGPRQPVAPVPPGPRKPPPPPIVGPFIPPPIATPLPMPPIVGRSWQLTLFGPQGGLRTRNDYPLVSPIVGNARAPGAPFVVSSAGEVLALEPERGDPVARARLAHADALPFGTIVAGAPMVGMVVGDPLRIVLISPLISSFGR